MNRRASVMNMALMSIAVASISYGAGRILDLAQFSGPGGSRGSRGVSMGDHNERMRRKRVHMNKIARRSRKLNGAKR
jgi:hypothetical protein